MDIGTLKAQIEANHRQFMAAITDMKKELKNVGSEAKKTGNDFDQLNNALSALGAGVAFNKISGAIKATVNEANKMQMAMQGLIEVSKSLNQDVEKTTGLAQELASKGFMSVTEAAEAVKTSLAMGLGLEETKNLVVALGDAAAYNRESHLGWGEAVVQAIRGIKMGESTLTDAAGITTNLSVMYERYADKIGTTAEKLTDAQKVQAAYNGMLQDAALFAGNAESALDGYQGSTARFNKSMSELKAEVGEAFMPIIADTLDALTPIIIELAKWASENENLVVTIGGVTLGITGLIGVLTTAAFVFNTLGAAAIQLQLKLGPIGWGLAAISLAASGFAIAQAKVADEAKKLEQSLENVKIATQANATESINLAKEYDQLSKKLSNLKEGSAGARETQKRMSDIMSELERKSPGLVSAYNKQTAALKNMTKAYVENALAIANVGKDGQSGLAYIDRMKQQTGEKLSSLEGELYGTQWGPSSEMQRAKLGSEVDELKKIMANYDIQERAIKTYKSSIVNQYAEALKAANSIVKDAPSGGDGGTTKSGGSSKSPNQKNVEDIAKENYQESLRWVQYKKALNQLSVEDELASYERLLSRYKQYNDIKMEMEERIYQTKGIMTQKSFENSSGWIEKEEMRMRLSGKTDQEVAQMKIDAWERVRSRYAANTEFYKQADRELYNIRIQIMREEQQALEEAQREREQALKEMQREQENAYKELKRNITESIREAESEELDAIRKAKDAEIEALRDREREELASFDRRRQEIEDFYSDQLDSIADEETAEEKAKLIAEIEKYKYATSKDGKDKYLELQEKLQEIERNEQRKHLNEQKEQELRNLDDRKDEIEDFYDKKERETSDHYDREYETIQEHYDDLLEKVEDYTGSVVGLEQLIANSRVNLNASANNSILAQTRSFVDEYNDLINEMESEFDSKFNSSSSSSSRNYNDYYKDSGHSSDYDDIFSGSKNTSEDDGIIRTEYDGGGTGWYDPKTGNFGYDFSKAKYHTGRDGSTGFNFMNPNQLMPDEIAAILQKQEYVFQPGQLDSLLAAAGGQKGQTINNYHAPLIEHNGDVLLEDQADEKTYWDERSLAAQRILSGGERL